jgi:hypothetical protein
MFPLPIPSHDRVAEVKLLVRVKNMEAMLTRSLQLLDRLAAALPPLAGNESLRSEVEALRATLPNAEPRLRNLDDLVARGRIGEVARCLRDALQLTWDQAHSLANGWSTLSAERKQALLRFSRA